MITTSDVAGVWSRCVPGMEAATLKVRVRNAGESSDSFDSYTLPRAKFKRLSKGEIPIEEGFVAERWRIVQVWADAISEATAVPPAALPCPDPKVGDILVNASGEQWVVKDVVRKLLDQVHNCRCEKAV